MTHNVPEKSSTKRDPDVNATDGETQTPKSKINELTLNNYLTFLSVI